MQGTLPIFNFNVVNKAGEDSTLELTIGGEIMDEPTREFLSRWYGDGTSQSFLNVKKTIDASGCKVLNVIVNSPGGSVSEAFAIADYLKMKSSNGVKVNTYGMGLIASAATAILMAGGKNSHIYENSWFMIHNVSSSFWGDSKQAMEFANTLKKFNDKIVNYYASVTGLDAETVSAMMDAETWMDGVECCKKGFVKNCLAPAEVTNTYNEATLKNLGFKNFKVTNMSTTTSTPTSVENALKAFTNKMDSFFTDIKNALSGKEKESGKVENNANPTAGEIADMLNKFGEGVKASLTEALNAYKPDVTTEITNYLATDAGKTAISAMIAENYVSKEDYNKLLEDIANKGTGPKNSGNKPSNGTTLGIKNELLDKISCGESD